MLALLQAPPEHAQPFAARVRPAGAALLLLCAQHEAEGQPEEAPGVAAYGRIAARRSLAERDSERMRGRTDGGRMALAAGGFDCGPGGR